jgi:hypothetical protein
MAAASGYSWVYDVNTTYCEGVAMGECNAAMMQMMGICGVFEYGVLVVKMAECKEMWL